MTLKIIWAHALLCAGVLLAPAHAAQPLADVERQIVSVAQWGGTPADPASARRQQITHITLHHQGEPFPPGKDPIAYLRTLQTWSRTTKHWLDIPYHYIIDLDGRIYEGRKIEYAGDTNTEYDPKGHALIEVVGNFEEVEPNQKQLDATVDLMALLAAKYKVSIDAIHGHKDYSAQTVCPGAHLYRYLQDGYFRQKVALRLAGARSPAGAAVSRRNDAQQVRPVAAAGPDAAWNSFLAALRSGSKAAVLKHFARPEAYDEVFSEMQSKMAELPATFTSFDLTVITARYATAVVTQTQDGVALQHEVAFIFQDGAWLIMSM